MWVSEEKEPIDVKLSSTRIRFLRARHRPTRLTDGGGLSLEIRPSGACLWRYRYRIAGKENVYAIGAFPELTLNDARAARDEARKLVQRGIHPAHQRRADRLKAKLEGSMSFEAVAREWLETKRANWVPRTYRQRRQLLEQDVLPGIGALPMGQVSVAHCQSALKRLEARAPQVAVLASQCIGAILRFAVATGRAETDLGYSLTAVVSAPARERKSTLRPAEIPIFFEALDRYPGQFPTKAAVRLVWLTLVRPKDVIEAGWADINLAEAVWNVAQPTHTRSRYAVPLPRQAVDLLGQLRRYTGSGAYLIPNRGNLKRPAAQSLLTKALTGMGYAGRLTPYGIRLTGREILAEQGYPRDVLEKQLGYAGARRVGADRNTRPDGARVAMMQSWADYLDDLRVIGDRAI